MVKGLIYQPAGTFVRHVAIEDPCQYMPAEAIPDWNWTSPATPASGTSESGVEYRTCSRPASATLGIGGPAAGTFKNEEDAHTDFEYKKDQAPSSLIVEEGFMGDESFSVHQPSGAAFPETWAVAFRRGDKVGQGTVMKNAPFAGLGADLGPEMDDAHAWAELVDAQFGVPPQPGIIEWIKAHKLETVAAGGLVAAGYYYLRKR